MEPVPIPQEAHHPTSHAVMAPVQQTYSAPQQQVEELPTAGVVADPNMEYGDDYGDYGGYDGADGGYDESVLDNSGLAPGGQDGNKGETDTLISSYFTKTSCPETGVTIWQCVSCDKTSKWKTSIKNHVESSHLNNMLQFHCSFCSHVNNTSAGLKMHTKRNHTFS